MANDALKLLKQKYNEWLCEVKKTDPHLIKLRKSLDKLAFAVSIAGGIASIFLPYKYFGALAIWIAIYVTYLGWRHK